MKTFDVFCRAVIQQVNGATKWEKAAICRELREHLEDHAAALTEDGLSAEEAARAAVDAMGDPKEIGEAMNQAYPHLWRRIYTIEKYAAVLLAIAAVFSLFLRTSNTLDHIERNWEARSYFSNSVQVLPMDVTMPVGDQILRVYGVRYGYETSSSGSPLPELTLYVCTYNRIPWGVASLDLSSQLQVADKQGNPLPSTCLESGYDDGSGARAFGSYAILVDEPPGELILTFDVHGHDASVRFAVPVPERLPSQWRQEGAAT